MAPALLGPPEVSKTPLLAATAAANATTATTLQTPARPANPFIDLMTAGFNRPFPPMGLTENLSATFVSSGNPCLDFFFQVVPDTPPSVLTDLLSSAWNQTPLTALKLVCHLRGVRGTGKSDKEGFYTAALWLHKHHPKTLALNVHSIADFGYLKDLPEILYRLLYGADVRKIVREERAARVLPRMAHRCGGFWRGGLNRKEARKQRRKNRTRTKVGTREERLAREMARLKIEMDNASLLRKKKRAEMAARALERYNRDPDYRFLHDRVADFFSERLLADIDHLKSGRAGKVGLAAKWCPSIDSSFDRSTLLCESIARRVFPRESCPEYAGIAEEHYAYRVRDRLRKEVLVPLRRVLELPELYMSANQWDKLPYNRVASVAMKTYKKLFQKHDAARFAEFLGRVKEGTAKIAAGALLPHELIDYEHVDEVAELQWRRMVSDLAAKGKLRNCIAVSDVSGSMEGTPMQVSIALGLLTSELSEEPWKGSVITFSEEPRLHRIAGETLQEKINFVKDMDWGGNTDFQKVFDRILGVAVEGGLPADQMVRRVFVFSDMEFDQASANPWETDYQAIQRKFAAAGYGAVVPEIVFWNLRDSRSTPVPSGQKGVALVSGFSKNLMTVFLDADGVLKPEDVMESAVAGDEYKKLAVFD